MCTAMDHKFVDRDNMDETKKQYFIEAVMLMYEGINNDDKIAGGISYKEVVDKLFFIGLMEVKEYMVMVEYFIDPMPYPPTDYQYNAMVDRLVGNLCGVSCGTAADAIIKYMKQPDISEAQYKRIKDSNL